MTRFSHRQLKCGARMLSLAVIYAKMFFHLHHPPFIPLVPYPPLRGTFPSRGRLTIRGYRHLTCGEAATRALSPSYQSTHSSFLPPSFGRRCPEGAEVGSRSGIFTRGDANPASLRFARLPLPEEGAGMILNRALPFIKIDASPLPYNKAPSTSVGMTFKEDG